MIKVTQDCINKGVPGDVSGCAVALAILETGRFETVYVSQEGASCYKDADDDGIEMVFEKHVGTFISSFDKKEVVMPFEFEPAEEILNFSGV